MTYAKVINNEIVEYNRTLPFSTANTSFGVGTDAETLKAHNYLPTVGSEPILEANQRINGVSYVVGTDEVTKVYEVVTIPIEEIIKVKQEHAESVIQAHINRFVISKGYDNENSIAKYLVVGNPFYAECSMLSLWIGAVWIKAYEVLERVLAGTLTEPNDEELVSMMPVFGE